MNSIDPIWRHAGEAGDRAALSLSGRIVTYEEVRAGTADWHSRFDRAGVRPGDRVLLVAPTSLEFVFAYHGILAVGAIAVTVNSMSTRYELEYFIEDCSASLIAAGEACVEEAEAAAVDIDVPVWNLELAPALVGPTPSGPVSLASHAGAVIIYTSGTTGRPKGALLTHGGLVESAEAVIEALHVTRDDKWATALPLFHVFGQITVMRTVLQVGGSLALVPRFDAVSLLAMCAEQRISILAGVPTMWNAMANADADADASLGPHDFTALRVALSGGAALPLEVARTFEERFGCEVLAGYGLTETTGAGALNRHGWRRKHGSAGPPWPRVSMRIIDGDGAELPRGEVGEIAIRTATIMSGYWNRPEDTAEVMKDHWFLTGDLGRMDSDDYVWIVGRRKEVIIRGGYNVYPREIEDVLYAFEGIHEAAVIGVPDDDLGEEVAAVITLQPGSPLDLDAIRDWVGQRLSKYKVPRIYQVVDELPKGTTGKILKRGIDADVVRQVGQGIKGRHSVRAPMQGMWRSRKN